MHALAYAYIGKLQVSPICMQWSVVTYDPFGKAMISVEHSLSSDTWLEPMSPHSPFPSTTEELLLSLQHHGGSLLEVFEK